MRIYESMRMPRISDRKGNLLVESIVAISVILIGFLGVLGLLSRSVGVNKDVSHKFIATYLAAEGIEVVKSLLDKNFADGLAWNDCCSDGIYEADYDDTALTELGEAPRPLLFDESVSSYNYDSGEQSLFMRVIEIEEFDRNDDGRTDELKILSRVEWSRRGEAQAIELEDHFFDWR